MTPFFSRLFALSHDCLKKIANAILELKSKGVDLIAVTGGMSVDPDDQTPGAVKMS
ncbi:MAG: hypothetical protein LUE90_05155, partial [Clostridiales bacterium]|nr:hypothetical protein [Clostridiales bacterium]